jgi:hypothetical protein
MKMELKCPGAEELSASRLGFNSGFGEHANELPGFVKAGNFSSSLAIINFQEKPKS